MIKNPNWKEATSWLFTKRGRGESETLQPETNPDQTLELGG